MIIKFYIDKKSMLQEGLNNDKSRSFVSDSRTVLACMALICTTYSTFTV